MATLEDKLLGEKKHYYCSSSESEGEDESEGSGEEKDERGGAKCQNDSPGMVQQEVNKWDGVSTNTGPKGVIKDWQRFKQLETAKRQENDLERLNLAKKLCLEGSNRQDNAVEEEFMELATDDDFMEEFRRKRMAEIAEMLVNARPEAKFGTVVHLANGSEFLDAIDNEDKSVVIVIHLYEDNVSACKVMNRCIESLAKQYNKVKFCKIVVSSAGMSQRFKVYGVPALLVYKEGQIIGNFVRITDELGDEFYDGDVENFLIEHGILSDRLCAPGVVQNQDEDNGGDSDWSLE